MPLVQPGEDALGTALARRWEAARYPTAPGAGALALTALLGGLLAAGLASGRLPFEFSPDGRVYVDVARHVAAGEGLRRSWTTWSWPTDSAPMVRYAPAYPMLLGAASWLLGSDPASLAGPLSAALYVALLVTIAELAWYVSAGQWMPMVAVAVIGLARPVLVVHTQALSEPLFLVLLLQCFLRLLRFGEAGRRRDLLGSALCAAGCLLTRYQGLFLLPVGVTIVALAGGPRRPRRAALWFAVAVAPLACWALRNRLVDADRAERAVGHHLPDYGALWSLFDTIARWFAPGALPQTVKLLVVIAAVAAVCGCWASAARHRQAPRFRRWCRLLTLATAAHLALLLAVRSFFDAAMPFDDRILAGIGVSALLALTLACTPWARPPSWRWPRTLATACLALTLAVHARGAGFMLREPDGSGPLGRAPDWSRPLAAAVAQAGPETTLYSNRAGLLIWYLQRPARYLPHAQRGSPELDPLIATVRRERGLIVYFHDRSGRERIVDLEILRSRPDVDCFVSTSAWTLCAARDPFEPVAETGDMAAAAARPGLR